jgi:hypothetical protein
MVCLTTKLKPSNKLFWFLLQFAFVKSCIIVICFVGSNILQAKMATRKAKPNGQYHLKLRDVIDFMKEQSVKDIPGKNGTVIPV